jgi:hypothetical protein
MTPSPRPIATAGPVWSGPFTDTDFPALSTAEDASRLCAGLENLGIPAHARSRGGVPPREASFSVIAAGQATLVSISRMLEAGEPLIAIRRGFIASGTSRTSSICDKPLSNAAPLT